VDLSASHGSPIDEIYYWLAPRHQPTVEKIVVEKIVTPLYNTQYQSTQPSKSAQ
jgi:hypothetical protein